jgi:hypothetical protein
MTRPSPFRRTTIAALLAASLTHMLGSSVATAAEGEAADALAPGSRSVQFAVQPNFTLGSYAGSTLSLKRHLASGNALRLGVSLGFTTLGDDFADVHTDTLFSFSQSSNFDGNASTIGLNALYLWYAGRSAPVHAYWGGGPTIAWSRSHDERTQTSTSTPSGQPPNTYTTVDDNRTRGWQVGVAGAVGVEWLVARRVGMFAEYGSSLVYLSIRSTRVRVTTPTGAPISTDRSEHEARRWDFSGSGGRLGVSVYY